MEVQPSNLFWAMDNWMYATRNAIRLRWTPNGALREPIGDPGGSWGITQDDDGRGLRTGALRDAGEPRAIPYAAGLE